MHRPGPSVSRTTSSFSRSKVTAAQAAIIVLLTLLWEFAPNSLLEELLWSRPSAILAQTVAWLADGTLLRNTVATLTTVVVGLLIGGLAGIAIGLNAGSSRTVARLIMAPIEALFALPKITLVPLFILWMGIGAFQHIAFTALVVFFLFFFAMDNGMRGVPTALVDTLTLAGASAIQRIHILYLPASFGWIVVAIRLAMPYAFVAAVSTEVIASTSGLGHLVKGSASIMNSAGMFAAMLALLFVSLVASALANVAAAKSRWRL
jgi:NitT/TauT family transport system permease protein